VGAYGRVRRSSFTSFLKTAGDSVERESYFSQSGCEESQPVGVVSVRACAACGIKLLACAEEEDYRFVELLTVLVQND
jgi:hypothetical protein